MYNKITTGGVIDINNINLAEEKKTDRISDKEIFSWNAPSFAREHKGPKWFVLAALIIVFVIGYSAWQQDWFVIGITVIVSAVMFWYVFSVHPKDVSYKITPMGIYVDEKFYPFAEIHSFWMVYNNNVKTIYFALIKKYLPTIAVSLENIDPLLVKGYFLKHVPEQERRGESLVDKLIRIIGL